MSLAIIAALAAVAFAFVGWPLFRSAFPPTGRGTEDASLRKEVEEEIARLRQERRSPGSGGPGAASMIALVLCAAALALAAFPGAGVQSILAQGPGVVEGRLSNGTPGGAPVAGVPVRLVSLLDTGGSATVADAVTQADGSFRFDGVNTEPSLRYQVRAAFLDGVFRSASVSFAPGSSTIGADIQVFDTTTDPATVRFAQVVAIVQLTSNRVVVNEPISVVNESERAYIGQAPAQSEARHTLVVPLPRSVQTVRYLDGIQPEDADLSSAGVFFRVPLAPGTHEMALRYEIPVTASRYPFSWRSEFATDRFDLLLDGVRAQVTGGALKDQGTVPFQGRDLRRLAAQGVPPGAAIEATLTHLPFFDVAQALRWAGLGTGILLGGFLAFLALRRARTPPTREELVAQRALLLEEVAALDERTDAGGPAARRQRDRRLLRLVAITRALREDRQ